MKKPHGIDLRREVEKIIRDHGHYVILVRQSPTGQRVERHQTYSISAAVPETLPRLLRMHQIGLLSSNARVFYFKHDIHIQQQDWIYPVEIDRFNRITEVGFMYKVNHVEKYREHLGRVEYVAVSCDREQGGGPGIDIKRARYTIM